MNLYKNTKSFVVIITLLLMSASVWGQITEKNFYSIDYLKESRGWLTSDNASGLTTLPLKSVSIAELGFNKSNGDFINYSESNDSYNMNAQVESFIKLNKSVFLYGKLALDMFRGNNMGGSVFMDPYFTSFNIVEYDPAYVGTKKREDYQLIGGIGVDLGAGWKIGAKIDYTAANYTKVKDLRHSNTLLDLKVSVGGSYSIGDVMDIGLNYTYRRNIESLFLKIYGLTSIDYYNLIDFGGFFGSKDLAGDNGHAGMNHTKPHVAMIHGADIQLNFNISERTQFFNELSFGYRIGHYGIKGESREILYSEHSGLKAGYRGKLFIDGDNMVNIVNLDFAFNNLTNNENVYKILTDENKAGYVEYYGSNEVLDRVEMRGAIDYSLRLGQNKHTPTWIIKVGANAYYKDLKATVYPFYRNHNLYSIDAFASGKWNKIVGRNIFSPGLKAGYGFGGGNPAEDGYLATPSETQKPPGTTPHLMYQEFEYFTSPRINAGINFKYSRLFNKGLTFFAKADYLYRQCLKYEYLRGGTSHSATITLGLNF